MQYPAITQPPPASLEAPAEFAAELFPFPAPQPPGREKLCAVAYGNLHAKLDVGPDGTPGQDEGPDPE